MNFVSQFDYGGYVTCSKEFYYMCQDPFHICYIYASPLIIWLTCEEVLTLSLYSFDCCAGVAENPSTHSAMMLAVEESEILPAFHALVDLAVRNLSKFKRNGISYPNFAVKFIVLLILHKHLCLLLIGGRFTLKHGLFVVGVV